MEYVLTDDVYSCVKKGLLYGKKNEMVTEIWRSGEVAIVRGSLGLFSMTIRELIGEKAIAQPEINTGLTNKRKPKKVQATQSLF
jgi:hypothetical protein